MITVISPLPRTHNQFVGELYESLCRQSVDWEWSIILNNGGEVSEKISLDKRVKIGVLESSSIGELKRQAVFQASGDLVAEVDADDVLSDDALADVEKAFRDSEVQFVYSNSAQFDAGLKGRRFDKKFGWRYRPVSFRGAVLSEAIAWEPSAHMMRFIFWAPNHIRAWRKSGYWNIGGHDNMLSVGDDHDLCCRFYIKYGVKGFRHIDKCLYFYRCHGGNSFIRFNAEIQKQTVANYCKYSRIMATRWADDSGLKKIDLGSREAIWPGCVTVDMHAPALVQCDLNDKWPFDDSSVGVIRASHVLEHLRDPVHSMNEAYRVLAPGGWFFIEVPSTDGHGAWQDPTHVSFWNENSIQYYTKETMAGFIKPKYVGRFQQSRVITMQQYGVPVVQADLICLKSPYSDRAVGLIEI